MSSPTRPRLAEHVLPRRHVRDGRTQVVLYDVAHDARLVLGPREWTVLALADGSRDLEGIRLASLRDGVRVELDELGAFFGRLAAEGLLEEGVVPRAPSSSRLASSRTADEGARPVRALPGYTFGCDASGECCGQYPTILFTPSDLVRARSAMPDVLDGGFDAVLAFTPERGTSARELMAGPFVDGRCAYQRADGLCGVHAVAGEAAKPAGCRLYPLTFVDDGDSVRVSLVCECPCAYRSARAATPGHSLVAPTIVRRDQLDPAAHVDRVADVIALGASRTVGSDGLPAWSIAVCETPLASGPRALVALADAVERHALEPAASADALGHVSQDPALVDVVSPRLAALGARTERRRREEGAWRDGRDAVGRGLAAVAGGALALGSRALLETALDDDAVPDDVRADERLYVRASAFGHHWITRRGPLAEVLRDRAARLLVARAIAMGLAGVEPIEHPLGRVEAIVRTHGVA
ncbi:MAG: YkgJ family cysteine cluster protein [Deltaproteobacteria bacterium]|nr:YkgJ family cysteine cluster protein [Deltaproteobacteria bacterium]